eukprot:13190130-Ditylum_brightwellii.AAC.1
MTQQDDEKLDHRSVEHNSQSTKEPQENNFNTNNEISTDGSNDFKDDEDIEIDNEEVWTPNILTPSVSKVYGLECKSKSKAVIVGGVR